MEWIKKNTRINTSNTDVSISITSFGKNKRGATKYGTVIMFRNKCFRSILKDSDYMIFAVDRKRIYFKKSDSVNGFKVYYTNKEKNNCRIKYVEPLDRFCGDYTLRYDSKENLYFIDADFKL